MSSTKTFREISPQEVFNDQKLVIKQQMTEVNDDLKSLIVESKDRKLKEQKKLMEIKKDLQNSNKNLQKLQLRWRNSSFATNDLQQLNQSAILLNKAVFSFSDSINPKTNMIGSVRSPKIYMTKFQNSIKEVKNTISKRSINKKLSR